MTANEARRVPGWIVILAGLLFIALFGLLVVLASP